MKVRNSDQASLWYILMIQGEFCNIRAGLSHNPLILRNVINPLAYDTSCKPLILRQLNTKNQRVTAKIVELMTRPNQLNAQFTLNNF